MIQNWRVLMGDGDLLWNTWDPWLPQVVWWIAISTCSSVSRRPQLCRSWIDPKRQEWGLWLNWNVRTQLMKWPLSLLSLPPLNWRDYTRTGPEHPGERLKITGLFALLWENRTGRWQKAARWHGCLLLHMSELQRLLGGTSACPRERQSTGERQQ